MQKITPCLWFDNNAEEAVDFYLSAFGNGEIRNVVRYGADQHGPEGQVMTIIFTLGGQRFMALNGGPHFKFTPAISFFVNRKTAAEVDALWEKLSDGGMALMPLDRYPFSEKFGWCMDKFGLSWQVNLCDEPPGIMPFLLFTGPQAKAEEAMKFYTGLLPDSGIKSIAYFEPGEGQPENAVKNGMFTLGGQNFMAMDGGPVHQFTFNEALCLVIHCENQAEIDSLWETMTADGGAEVQCGWLRDKFGVSWQIVPLMLSDMMRSGDAVKMNRMMQAMLKMVKLDIAELRSAFEGQAAA